MAFSSVLHLSFFADVVLRLNRNLDCSFLQARAEASYIHHQRIALASDQMVSGPGSTFCLLSAFLNPKVEIVLVDMEGFLLCTTCICLLLVCCWSCVARAQEAEVVLSKVNFDRA